MCESRWHTRHTTGLERDTAGGCQDRTKVSCEDYHIMMKDDEDRWIDCWRFSDGGGRTACICEEVDVSSLDARAQDFHCSFSLFIIYLCVSFIFKLFLYAVYDCKLATFHAFLSYSSFFYAVCEIIFLPLSPASPIFSLRGLFVEVMACWCLRLSLGLYCWCFFPTHTQTCARWVFTADTQLHSLLQLHLLSPWRPCLLLNPLPSSQTHTHTHTMTEKQAGCVSLCVWFGVIGPIRSQPQASPGPYA